MYHWEEMLISSIKCNQHGQVGQLEFKKLLACTSPSLCTTLQQNIHRPIANGRIQKRTVDKIS